MAEIIKGMKLHLQNPLGIPNTATDVIELAKFLGL